MGAWGAGIFDNDDAADWVVEFDDAEPQGRAALIGEALDLVDGVEPDEELGVDDCGQVAAAAATVALLSSPDEPRPVGAPESLPDAGVEVTAQLRARAVDGVRAVLFEESEWYRLWAEGDELDAARAPLLRAITLLEGSRSS